MDGATLAPEVGTEAGKVSAEIEELRPLFVEKQAVSPAAPLPPASPFPEAR
jgi:hypothetical protein